MKHEKLCALLTILMLLIACAETVPLSEEESAKRAFEHAQGYKDGLRYELALEKFSYVKNKYPFTEYAVLAELEIAHTYFLKGDYVEAIAAYEAFRDLHPSHKSLSEVTYKIAQSYFELAPRSVDRDLIPLKQGIQVFQELIRKYPASPYVEDARKNIKDGRGRLAQKEIYIGDFYFKRGTYNAAILRYKNVLSRFSDAGSDAETYYKLGESYQKLGETKDAAEAYKAASSRYADTEWGVKAEERLRGLK